MILSTLDLVTQEDHSDLCVDNRADLLVVMKSESLYIETQQDSCSPRWYVLAA